MRGMHELLHANCVRISTTKRLAIHMASRFALLPEHGFLSATRCVLRSPHARLVRLGDRVAYLALAGAASVAGFAAGVVAAFSFLATCLTFLCVAAFSAFGAALAAAGVAGVAGAPVWANTGRAKAESRAATMMEVDFMMVFLGKKFFRFKLLLQLMRV